MAKLSKNEIMKKYVDSISDENLSIEFMEDIADSIEENLIDVDAISAELEEVKTKLEQSSKDLEDMKSRYKERFVSSDEIEETSDIVNDEEVYEEKEEKEELIDVKEI